MKRNPNRIGFRLLSILEPCILLNTLPLFARNTQFRASSEPICETVTPQRVGDNKVIQIGNIWSGVRTMIGAAEPVTGKLLVAYYDADRWVTLASADAGSGKVCKIHLKSQFPGWDGHNSLAMAIAPDRSVHLAGNAHATPLFYAQAQGYDLATVRETPLLGRNEDKATYPTFYKDADGRLIFFYRTGGSGDGLWIANRWTGKHWERLGASFSANDRARSHISAYPSPIITGQHGVNHVAIIWRKSPDVATNFAVGYARTTDFQHWSGALGASLKGPVRPDQIDIVDQPGENAGLLNNARMLLSADGNPVLFYTRYGARGTDALIAAQWTSNKWNLKEIASSDKRTPIKGEGSLPGAPAFSVSSNGNIGNISVAFPGRAHMSFQLDLRTLDSVKTLPDPPTSSPKPTKALLTIPSGLANPSLWNQPVTASGFDGPSKSRMFWYAQGLNRDHAWTCTTQFPRACTPPPSPLLWVIPAR